MAHQRTNNATRALVDHSDGPFATGAFKLVWRGIYIEGDRAGEPCVVKEFKTGSVYEGHYFNEEMNIIARTQKVIDDWHAANVINRKILLNTPEIWMYKESKHKALVEPFISNYEKWNSNSGWTPANSNIWVEVMQALSHFSYHNSGGQFLLCDLQGGSYSDGYILSDPVIMSQLHNCGPADLGPKGILSFFVHHRCGCYCSRQWMRPSAMGAPSVPMRQGTTMDYVPIRPGVNPLSKIPE